MDQTKPEDQIIPRYIKECRAVTDLGGYDLLSPHVLHQIPDQIQRLVAGTDQDDPRGPHDAQEHHRSALVEYKNPETA